MKMVMCLQIPQYCEQVKELLLSVIESYSVNNVRQTEIHTAQPLVPEPCFKVEITTEKLKRYKSVGTDQIPPELIQAGDSTLHSKIHQLINSIWDKEELMQQWKEFIIIPIY
jgi:hypothetical protein